MRFLMTIAMTAFASSAFASPQCTTEPKNKWISESAMRIKAEAVGNTIEVFKEAKSPTTSSISSTKPPPRATC